MIPKQTQTRTWSRGIVGAFLLLTLVVWLAGCGGPQTTTPPSNVSDRGATSARTGDQYPPPDVSAYTFAPVTFSGSANNYKSGWTLRTKSSNLELGSDGLVCDLVGGEASDKGIYGGVAIPVPAPPKALKLDLSFKNPQGIAILFVDGYTGPKTKPVVRWEWRATKGREIPEGANTYVLVPGKGSGFFHASKNDKADRVTRVDVFVRINPGADTGFTLHKLEVGK